MPGIETRTEYHSLHGNNFGPSDFCFVFFILFDCCCFKNRHSAGKKAKQFRYVFVCNFVFKSLKSFRSNVQKFEAGVSRKV